MHLTYHPPVMPKSGRSRWTNLGNGFCQLQTVGRGQEFVLDYNNYGSQSVRTKKNSSGSDSLV